MDRVTSSFKMVKCIWNLTPVSGSQLTPYFSPKRREAAFLMMAWQSETDMSWEFRQWPLTGNWPSAGNVLLQIGVVHALEQLLEGLCLELGQDDHNALAGPQADIGLGQSALVAGEQDPAVLHPDIFHIHSSQLVACQALQAEQGGNCKLHFFHKTSIT